MPQVIGSELRLEAILGFALRARHHTSVRDNHIEGLGARQYIASGLAHTAERGEICFDQINRKLVRILGKCFGESAPRLGQIGGALGHEITQRYQAATGKKLAYVIGTMWDGGNTAHYSPDRPRVLVDGSPARAPWIDLADLRAKGAAVVWTDGDPHKLPEKFDAVAAGAQIQPSFTLPYRRGPGGIKVGWAILPAGQ